MVPQNHLALPRRRNERNICGKLIKFTAGLRLGVKRIGLLFSAAELDIQLDPEWMTDINNIENADTNFSDGCGLMSKHWAVQVSKAKRIIFRNQRYVPCVPQIRYKYCFYVRNPSLTCFSSYLGYKGVLMMHPEMDKEKTYLTKFRKSMKKFSTMQYHSFSIVGYSRPYASGCLNTDTIVLLSGLGVTNEKLVAKQEAFFRWIEEASTGLTPTTRSLTVLLWIEW